MSTDASRIFDDRSRGRHRSKQTRILGRRLTAHTVITWLVYSAAFAVLAMLLNALVVPYIAEMVVRNTAATIYYDPHYYITRYGGENLLDSFIQQLDSEGIEYELVLFDSDAAASYDVQESADDGSNMRDASSEDDPNRQLGILRFISAPGYDQDAIESSETLILTPAYLAQQAIERDFAEVTSSGGEWQILTVYPESEDGLTAFEAREISFYNTIKQLKLPTVVALYLLGCLIIIMVEMRRAMGYFDQLSGAVADLISDRHKPVRLSRALSLAQDELNNIRLEALNDERVAISAEQRKNELVAYLAHDIRTPLTSIIGYLSMLDESPDLPEDQRKRFTHTAFIKAESLEGLINEFFEITRYNLQKIPLERSWIDINIMLQQMADEFLPQASSHDVDIKVSAPDDAKIFADAAKLARALENVLRNAIAYADAGTDVDIAVEKTSGSASDAEADVSSQEDGWKIAICDTGREIAEAHLESIFDKFYREDAARSTDGGAGLGLAIAKEIVTAHGGTIQAASAHGRTCFTITLPDPAPEKRDASLSR